jgi:hypothetical protein
MGASLLLRLSFQQITSLLRFLIHAPESLPLPFDASRCCPAELNAKHDWGLSIHIDGASGAFVAPFLYPDLKWDFRLDNVASINASGAHPPQLPVQDGQLMCAHTHTQPVHANGNSLPTNPASPGFCIPCMPVFLHCSAPNSLACVPGLLSSVM